MNCPHCREVMVTLEFSDIEVDHCLACGGIWLDRGEMAHLLGHGEGDIGHALSTPPVGEKPRRCPLCRRTMIKVGFGENDAVVLDRCGRHGTWTDAGELRKILAPGASEGAHGSLIRLLDDIFAARNNKGGCL